jgi:predicted phosphodiesterase
MKLQILSDLHIEFKDLKIDFSKADVVILAGDIDVGLKGFDWIEDRVKDKPVLYVLGNHEYYKHTYPKLLNDIKEKATGTNIHIFENDSMVIGDVCFHGCSLWTDFELFGDPRYAGMYCQELMTDYRLIRKDPSYSKLRTIDTYHMHQNSLDWLEESLAESKSIKNVVITHHAPSIKSVIKPYKDDLLSAAFASNLEAFILEKQPDLWIHGHVHWAFDYRIGKTRVFCNPRGYPDEAGVRFNQGKIVRI